MHAPSTEDVREEGFARDSSAHWGRFAKRRSERGRNDKSASICRPYWEQSAEQTLTDALTNHFVMKTLHFWVVLFLRKLHIEERLAGFDGRRVFFSLWDDFWNIIYGCREKLIQLWINSENDFDSRLSIETHQITELYHHRNAVLCRYEPKKESKPKVSVSCFYRTPNIHRRTRAI